MVLGAAWSGVAHGVWCVVVWCCARRVVCCVVLCTVCGVVLCSVAHDVCCVVVWCCTRRVVCCCVVLCTARGVVCVVLFIFLLHVVNMWLCAYGDVWEVLCCVCVTAPFTQPPNPSQPVQPVSEQGVVVVRHGRVLDTHPHTPTHTRTTHGFNTSANNASAIFFPPDTLGSTLCGCV